MDKELRPEDCRREVTGEMPHGGVKVVIYFLDENERPCLEKDAKIIHIVEYDKNGEGLFSILGVPKD